MKECLKVKRLLSSYIDKELGYADDLRIKRHLDKCPLCRQELSELLSLKEDFLKQPRKHLPPDYLICRLRDKIAEESKAEEKFSLVELGSLSRKLIPVPVGVIVLSAVLLIYSFRQPESSYSIEDSLFNASPATTETALELMLGPTQLEEGGKNE